MLTNTKISNSKIKVQDEKRIRRWIPVFREFLHIGTYRDKYLSKDSSILKIGWVVSRNYGGVTTYPIKYIDGGGA